MRDITEILMHWQAGRSVRQIARSLGVDRPLAETGDYRSTVRKYVRRAASLGYQPKQTNLSAQEWAVILEQQAPALSMAPPRSTVFSEIAGYHEKIETDLQTNSASTIWQRLHDEHGSQGRWGYNGHGQVHFVWRQKDQEGVRCLSPCQSRLRSEI